MKYVKSKTVSPLLLQVLLTIWNEEYPAVLKHYLNTLEEYLNKLKDLEHTFVMNEFGTVVGWYFDFERNNERQFAILISSDYHNKGIGNQLLSTAKQKHSELYGWVVDSNEYLKKNGENYKSPVSFYQNSGFNLTNKRWDSEKIKTIKIVWRKEF
ncbi:MAG: GNAT superfamily N-acetyltransferase [Vicingaceae bacterium]|jgi:GNAT superfamily N-acetyltransferase